VVFLEDDALEIRRRAVEAVLASTLDAVVLLRIQVTDPELDAKERRAAAIALLNIAGLSNGPPPGTQGAPRPPQVEGLLEILNSRNDSHRVDEDPFK
jgi:hypothetical protein